MRMGIFESTSRTGDSISATIGYKTFSRERVNIIIPFHNKYHLVSKLVKSIIKYTLSNPYQIVLVDDCSPPRKDEKGKESYFIDEFKDFDANRPFGSEPMIKTIRSKERLGFGGALKLGFDNCDQPWVVFMHSDCWVDQTNWLIEMGRCLVKNMDKRTRMVGPRSSAVVAGTDENIFSFNKSYCDDFVVQSFLPLCCTMCHRNFFSEVGGFIKNYPYYGYEDQELAYRMKFFGYNQMVCGSSWIHHAKGGTSSLLLKDKKTKEEVAKNRERCLHDLQLLFNKF